MSDLDDMIFLVEEIRNYAERLSSGNVSHYRPRIITNLEALDSYLSRMKRDITPVFEEEEERRE